MSAGYDYTLADLDRIARTGARTTAYMAADWRERYDLAWMGAVEALYSAKTAPLWYDLVRAGQAAIYESVDKHLQAHGYYRRSAYGAQYGPASSPSYRAYWWDLLSPMSRGSHEAGIVDRIALGQIWPTLRDNQRQALLALAAHDNNYPAAAAALGWGRSRLSMTVSRARATYLALWHEGEAPSRQWRMAGRGWRKGAGVDV